jgi:hypothetical protein
MHIDAFFEYMLGKQHPYYLQIPPPHDPFPEEGRDGVPLEEDLAIRALDPKFKPKRGRRKADDVDDEVDVEVDTPARKRPSLDTSIPFGTWATSSPLMILGLLRLRSLLRPFSTRTVV